MDYSQDYATEILVGATVSGLQFGHSDLGLLLYKEQFSLFGELVKGPLYIGLTNKWRLIKDGDQVDSEITELSIDAQFSLLYPLRELSIVKAEILKPIPHLLIHLDDGVRLLINGQDDKYETWEFGVGEVRVIGLPDLDVAILHPNRFK